MESRQDFKSLQEGVQKPLLSVVKAANRIAAQDLAFQRTISSDAAQQLDDVSARLLKISTKLLESAASACGVKGVKLDDIEDVEMKWQGIVDVVDSVLEKADTALDEYTGFIKRRDPTENSSSKKPKSTGKVIRNANVVKPQLSFDVQPDNFPTTPWKPILTSKPHASVSLKKSLVKAKDENSTEQYRHPYETEIKEMEYPDRVYKTAEPIPSQPVDTTKATWVDTYEGVLDMLKDLKKASEIAVDLEHHDFRTYTGLVSLMQISTREKDWIVDTLKPWRQQLEVLNEVFADPSIIKVFHGAYMDMIWLQRDLGLYVNGLFDTFFACEQLYSGRSLAFLLSKFVNFDADKQYQLADWRIRPIPTEMLYYARSDTHYLLYIYDRVRNDLVNSSDRSNPELDYVGRALQRSRELSLSRHLHADYNEQTGEGPRGWYNYVLKHSHLAYNGEQFAVFQALWKWRDTVARTEDESPNFVLGTTNVAEIARVNPPDAKALHSLLPLTAPLAKARVNAMWEYVQEAQAKGGPSLLQFFAEQAPEGVTRSGARPVKDLTALPSLDGAVAATRLPKSQLFGDMPISTLWDGSKRADGSEQDQIPFPWQRFVESIEDAVEDMAIQKPEQLAPDVLDITPAQTPTAPAKRPQPEEEEEFTLKKGKKRKSESLDEDESSTSEESSSEEEDEDMKDTDGGVIDVNDEAAQKKALLEANKEEKRLKRERRQLAEQRRDAKKKKQEEQKATKAKRYDAVPFDYSQATSVLHASRAAAKKDDGKGDKKGKNKKKPAFNPYSKSADDGAIKTARKPMPIRGERSATFKK